MKYVEFATNLLPHTPRPDGPALPQRGPLARSKWWWWHPPYSLRGAEPVALDRTERPLALRAALNCSSRIRDRYLRLLILIAGGN